ncbi:hypothetical protein AJ79_09107 [Helicocarpus griseus UAMH5409]|uniref:Uncharacterized protein n=1 Tax=Helicocarpus griseus UAMH5409 TaxID=1447875 RepID=A0A2B7WME0_9EURO|nr:hypothetical protein AJ79_09107 [Helicocarpus griseus UAMH5409]
MTAALPYLRGLRKSDLVVLAELANLQDYEDYKKVELEGALDDHLSANRASLSGEQKLAEYYRRLSQPARASPIKREPKTEPAGITSGEEVAKRPARARRQIKPKQEIEATDESDSSSAAASSSPPTSPQSPAANSPSAAQSQTQTRTPARPSLPFSTSLPPSPAVITDAIDRQTTKARKSMSDAWVASGLTERSHALRSCLSSVRAIETITLLLELSCLLFQIVPVRYLATFPAVERVGTPAIAVRVPDLFILLEGSFWGPFSLWVLTSLALPGVFAWFFNLSLKISQQAASTHSYGTRRSSAAAAAASQTGERSSFDPLVYHVAKALVAYVVYGGQFTFGDVYSLVSVRTVAGAVPGGLQGLLTGAAVGGLGSLYEAILRK